MPCYSEIDILSEAEDDGWDAKWGRFPVARIPRRERTSQPGKDSKSERARKELPAAGLRKAS